MNFWWWQDCGNQDAECCADADMPGRTDDVEGDDRTEGAGQHDGKEVVTAAEPHGQSEEIDRQENIDAKCFRITDHAAEKCADYRCQYPGHPYDRAHCEIPAKRRRFSSIFAFYRLCELRIDEQEKSKPALDVRITADDRSECRGIEDMAKVYCQNG
ncbi:hypothetical protein D3C73_837600 [compost metagenome]